VIIAPVEAIAEPFGSKGRATTRGSGRDPPLGRWGQGGRHAWFRPLPPAAGGPTPARCRRTHSQVRRHPSPRGPGI